MKEQRWQDWINVLLGAWLVLSPFFGIGGTSDLAAMNSYLAGTAVAVFAIAALTRPQMWEEYTNIVLGIWLILAPFVLGFTNQAAPMWNQIIVGLLIGAVALAVTLEKTTPPTAGQGHA